MTVTERRLAEVPSPSPPARMSFEEFLEHGPETHAEWVNGEVIEMSPPIEDHQDVSILLASALRAYADDHHIGKVLAAPFLMKTGPNLPGREPDILFIAGENLHRLKRTHLEGPADLVVEIVSRESRGRDRGDKYVEYEQGGVREYWLLDPERMRGEFYALDERGMYQNMAIDEDGVFRSAVLPGLWLNVGWLWQRPLPSLRSILAEWESS